MSPFLAHLISSTIVNDLSGSFHYWRLNPDQATSDPKKSPDPLAVLTAGVELDETNENRNAEKYGKGQLVGDEGGAVKDIQERIRCNDSVV